MLFFFDSFDSMDEDSPMNKYRWLLGLRGGGFTPFGGAVMGPGYGKMFNGLDGGLYMAEGGQYLGVPVPDGPVYTAGGWVKLDSPADTVTGTVMAFQRGDGNAHFSLIAFPAGELGLVTSGGLVLYTEPGVVQWGGVWQHIEVHGRISNGTGAVCVRINEEFVLTYFGRTSSDVGDDTSVGDIRFIGGGGPTYWDSIYVTAPGGPNSAFLGMAEATAMLPVDTGNSTEWEQVDGAAPVAYNSESAGRRVLDGGSPVGNVDLRADQFGHPTDTYILDALPDLGAIRSVQAGAYLVDDRIPLFFQGVDTEIIVHYGGVDHVFYSAHGDEWVASAWPVGLLDLDPQSGTPWTVGSLATKEFGVHKAGSLGLGADLRMYHMSVEVLFGGNAAPGCRPPSKRTPWAQIIEAYAHG